VARALLRLVRWTGLTTVVDIGAGRGELLRDLHVLAPELRLVAVEVAARPVDLPTPIHWSAAIGPAVDGLLDGLVVAHEWLDNVPCHVVEVDEAGVPRMVHVDPATGAESLGLAVDGPGVPTELGRWLATWWPLGGRAPGTRAEVGTARDRAWTDVVARLGRGLAVAVDHGHLRDDRPPAGSLRSYRNGEQVPVRVDGSCDVTAGVAVDALAAAAGARLHRQRDVLTALGLDPALPPSSTAEHDPEGYLRAVAGATRAADLLRAGGLGDFHWVFSSVGGVEVPLG